MAPKRNIFEQEMMRMKIQDHPHAILALVERHAEHKYGKEFKVILQEPRLSDTGTNKVSLWMEVSAYHAHTISVEYGDALISANVTTVIMYDQPKQPMAQPVAQRIEFLKAQLQELEFVKELEQFIKGMYVRPDHQVRDAILKKYTDGKPTSRTSITLDPEDQISPFRFQVTGKNNKEYQMCKDRSPLVEFELVHQGK